MPQLLNTNIKKNPAPSAPSASNCPPPLQTAAPMTPAPRAGPRTPTRAPTTRAHLQPAASTDGASWSQIQMASSSTPRGGTPASRSHPAPSIPARWRRDRRYRFGAGAFHVESVLSASQVDDGAAGFGGGLKGGARKSFEEIRVCET